MKLICALLAFVSLSVHAGVIQLESGDFEVRPVDRYGRVQVCTFQIENVQAEGFLVLNVQDCPPVITDVKLYLDPRTEFYVSAQIPAETSERGGYKLYEIHPLSPTQFKITSFRVYENGQSDRPRSIVANKR